MSIDRSDEEDDDQDIEVIDTESDISYTQEEKEQFQIFIAEKLESFGDVRNTKDEGLKKKISDWTNNIYNA